ncbi:MAG: ATP-binding protein, partial [Actinobacteria bacterium]|nr:ATP-binding protein [Actinomycetota bacterium]
MTWLPVDVQADHLESLVRGEPISGVIELVWNAIDAEAENVRVIVAESPLGGVEEVRVEDDGHGMTRADIDDEFAHLGGSWKRLAQHSKHGKRVLHGAEGKGRWRAFTIGPEVRWTTVAPLDPPRQKTTVTGRSDRLGGFDVSDPVLCDEPTGTVVKVTCSQPGPSGLLGDRAPKVLTATLALHLQRYRDGLTVMYRGSRLDPGALQERTADYGLDVPSGYGEGKLTIIEWSEDVDVKRGLFLCDASGVVLDDLKAGIQAKGFEFTAYVQWDGFREMSDRLWRADTDETLAPVVESAKSTMREHFKLRRDENKRTIVQNWKDQRVYPYSEEPQKEPAKVTRDLFDVVAVTAAPAVNASDDPVARRFSLSLIREALENNPTSLRRVLAEVLQLPQESLDELNALLDQTSLTEIISASRLIANRLDFIEALKLMVFEPEVKGKLKERSQLHRILAAETWIFGEEFN